MSLPDPAAVAADLSSQLRVDPELAIVLGSGFQDVLGGLRGLTEIPYAKIPGFPRPSVPGHAGRLVLATSEKLPVLALYGRSHYYEALEMAEVTFPIRVLAALGVRDLILTNAAGGISPRLRHGDFMCITDHINFMGVNPLRGQTSFVDLTTVYDPALIALWRRSARHTKVRLATGVYLAVSGPSYETPAEIRAFARLGADTVGMSTVPEAIVARQCGMRVTGLSCITNLAAGRTRKPLSHAEVLETGRRVSKSATELLSTFLNLYAEGH
ncbi:MAG: purine-nucleoside phosphorylase [Verrucomicrobia bacterium]|nr:MAG: purine-nucleoside phosphorylase [Verrucomicrobiota bacterium]